MEYAGHVKPLGEDAQAVEKADWVVPDQRCACVRLKAEGGAYLFTSAAHCTSFPSFVNAGDREETLHAAASADMDLDAGFAMGMHSRGVRRIDHWPLKYCDNLRG